jgi:ATP adenylyltransferase
MKKNKTKLKTKLKNSKAKKSSRVNKVSLLKSDIWPQERDVIYRPERYRYVRKLVKSDGCVFCKAASQTLGFESLVLQKNSRVMVILNKFPYNSGHVMVLPVQHEGDFLNLTDELAAELGVTIKKVTAVLQKVYQPSGFNIGMNNGAIAGAGIPEHLHWHIIPRWLGDTNFFPLIGETKVLPETLEQTYEKLKGHF